MREKSIIDILKNDIRHIYSLKNSEFRNLVSAANEPYLVSDNVSLNFIDDFSHKSAVSRLGGNYLYDLNTTLQYPRFVKVELSEEELLLPEVADSPEIDINFAYSDTSPRRFGCFAKLSKLISLQNPGLKSVLNKKITQSIVAQVERHFFHDLVLNPDVNNIPAAPLSHDALLDMEASIGIESELIDDIGFAFSPLDLKKVKKVATAGGELLYKNGMLGGYRAVMTKAVPAGNLIFGKWNNSYILNFDQIQIIKDPFSDGMLGQNN